MNAISRALGGLAGAPILVLGLTYRHGVKELAYSRAIPLIQALARSGAQVLAHDPLLSAAEVRASEQSRTTGARRRMSARS